MPDGTRGIARRRAGKEPAPIAYAKVCIGLVVTEDGFPLGYEVFAGNTHDSTTVQAIFESLERKHGPLNRLWVMDRGMVGEENLKFLRQRGEHYIIGSPKAMLRRFEQHLTEKDWTTAPGGCRDQTRPKTGRR